VNHGAETMAVSSDTSLAPLRQRRTCRAGRREGQRSMRPVAVVMLHKDVEDPPKMLIVQDPQPVENGCKWVSRASPKSRRETLPDGISRSQWHRWQTVAVVPAPISLNDVRPIRLSASQSLSVAPSTAPRRGLARPLNLLRAEGTFLHGASSFSLGF
jgi:hypothetical protein